MSILLIVSIASLILFDFTGSGSFNIWPKTFGILCHERPYLSLSQPPINTDKTRELLKKEHTLDSSGLWQQQDKRPGARQILREIYGWFTEGFDTKDPQEAKALLEKLA
jgi:hypothetical protein